MLRDEQKTLFNLPCLQRTDAPDRRLVVRVTSEAKYRFGRVRDQAAIMHDGRKLSNVR
jgi:hypothetical protein